MSEYNNAEMQNNEIKREQGEKNRIENEIERINNEAERKNKELDRIEKEKNRVIKEQDRIDNEKVRVENEIKREKLYDNANNKLTNLESELMEVNSQLEHVAKIVTTSEELQNAIDNNTTNIILADNLVLNSPINIHNKENIKINGNNKIVERNFGISEAKNVFDIRSSSNIKIKNITIFGNNEKYGVKDNTSHNIAIYGSEVYIENCVSEYSVCDGVYINRDNTSVSRVIMQNVLCDFNGRQGMSIVCSDYVYAKNCKFNNTGRSSSGGVAPIAGVDLEKNTLPYVPKNCVFEGCEFNDNKGQGFINNGYSINTVLNNCFIYNNESYGLTNQGELTLSNIIIDNCGISDATTRPSLNMLQPYDEIANVFTIGKNIKITNAKSYGCSIIDGHDVEIKGLIIENCNNFGLRISGDSSINKNIGKNIKIESIIVKNILNTELTPSGNKSFINSPTSVYSNVTLRDVSILKEEGVNCVEYGSDLIGLTSIKEISNANFVGNFSTVQRNWDSSEILYNNKVNDVYEPSINRARIFYRTSIPSSTNITYYKNDIVYNQNTKSGGFIGWVCVSGGSPGEWKGFGLIE